MPRATWLATLTAAALMPLLAQAAAEQQFRSEEGTLTVSTLADGLRNPWALAFLPGGKDMLVTERAGNLRVVNAEGKVGPPISGVPKVWAEGQGGLLDVVLSPEFDKDRTVYLSYAEEGSDGKAGTAVGRGQLSEDRARLDNFSVIFRQQPKLSVGNHFGSRLVFDRDGYLFIALGENNQRPTAQDLDKLQGKIVRILPDGEVPKDNPFVGKDNVRPEIWSFGHRNQQGAALNPGPASCGPTSTARAVATKSTSPSPARTMAGRLRPMASTTRCCRFPRPRASMWTAWSTHTMCGRSHRVSAAWRSTTARHSRPGTTTCSLVHWRHRS
ncbi:glucose sorbosone dehydrogenase [Pseudomonas putida]|nr:glucose sorbosone dehydrogenase [Pseudomonas putida]